MLAIPSTGPTFEKAKADEADAAERDLDEIDRTAKTPLGNWRGFLNGASRRRDDAFHAPGHLQQSKLRA